MNEVLSIRTAAFELCAADTNDVVKVAGVLRKIKNWWKAFTDESYREEVAKLREQSAEINELLNEFQKELEKLQKSISDVDVYDYGSSLDKVRSLSAELSVALNKFYAAADHAEKVVPTKTVEQKEEPKAEPGPKAEEKEYVVHYNINQWKDKEFKKKLSEQKAEGNDVPVSNKISKPVQSFKWFQNFSVNDIDIGDNFISAFIIRLASELSRKQDIFGNPEQSRAYYETLLKLPEVESQLINKLTRGVLMGKLERYSPAKPSAAIKERPAGEMTAAISVDKFEVTLPKGNIFEQDPTILISAFVLANDLRNAFVNRGDLSLSGIIHVRIIGTSRLERQKLKEEEKTQPNPSKDYPEDESIYGDHNEFWDQYGDCNDKLALSRIDELKKFAISSDWTASKAVTREQQQRAKQLLYSSWKKGLISLEDGIQYRGDFHPNYPGQLPDLSAPPGKHRGVEVWVPSNSPAAKPSTKPSVKPSVLPPWKPDPSKRAPANERELVLAEFEKRGWPREEANAMIWTESGWDPSARNVQGFSGLIGFGPWFGPGPSSRFKNKWGLSKPIWEMTAAEQAPLVGRYLDEAVGRRRWRMPGDTYLTGAAPGFVGAPDDKIVYPRGSKAWEQNPGWRGPDGEITAGSIRAVVLRKQQRLAKTLPPKQQQPAEKAHINNHIKQMPGQEQQLAIQQDYDELIQKLFASGPIEKFVRTAIERAVLPSTSALIVLKSDNFPCTVRYAHVLASALRSELGAETSIHSDGKNIELECELAGSERVAIKAICGLSTGISEAFKEATGHYIITDTYSGNSSKFEVLKSEDIENNFRKFAFEMMGTK